MNSVGVKVGNNLEHASCQQYITDLKYASETFLNPLTYMQEGWAIAQGVNSVTIPSTVSIE